MSAGAAKLLLKTSLGGATGAKMGAPAVQIDAQMVSWAAQVVPERENGTPSGPNWRPNGVLSNPSGAKTESLEVQNDILRTSAAFLNFLDDFLITFWTPFWSKNSIKMQQKTTKQIDAKKYGN